MNDPPAPDSRTTVERERLEQAHHDICTALTVLKNNVELARIRILRDQPESTRVAVHVHLDEIDWAHERLHQVARDLKAWRAASSTKPNE